MSVSAPPKGAGTTSSARRTPAALLHFTAAAMRWAMSFGRRFWLAVTLSATSRVAHTAAMFLPIKIVILLGEHKPPGYFALLAPLMPYAVFLGILIAAVPLIYGYSLGTRIFASRDLAQMKRQLGRDGHQWAQISEGRLGTLWERMVRIGADLGVIGMCLMGIAVCDWRLALFSLLLGGVYFIVVELWSARRGGTIISTADMIEYFGVGVFIAFFCAVIGLLFVFDTSVLLSILALLLGRLLFQALERVLKDVERVDKSYAAEIARGAD